MILIIVAGVFFGSLIYLAINEGLRPPLFFFMLWLAGLFASGLFGVSSGAAFIAWQALLCVAIQFLVRFRDAGL